MGTRIRGRADQDLKQVRKAIASYHAEHPQADGELYRHSSVSLRVRIIDPDFAGMSRAERHQTIWRCFEELPEEIQSQISVLLLLSPDEVHSSFANTEFDDPVPSKL